MKVEILGKRSAERVNKETGEVKTYNDLYYVELKEMKPGEDEKCAGRKAGSVSTQMDISKIEVGGKYDLDFEVRTYKGNTSLKLVDYEEL